MVNQEVGRERRPAGTTPGPMTGIRVGLGPREREYYVTQDPITGTQRIMGYAAQSAPISIRSGGGAPSGRLTVDRTGLGKRSRPDSRGQAEDYALEEGSTGYADEEDGMADEYEGSYQSGPDLAPEKTMWGLSMWATRGGRALMKPLDIRFGARILCRTAS